MFFIKNDQHLHELIIVTIIGLVWFMQSLDTNIINTAIPSIANDFMINPILLNFAVASYYIGLAIFIPISGWCADRFGEKRSLLLSIFLFTIASFFCGFAHNITELTIFRFIQGVGCAFMVPICRIVLNHTFPRARIMWARNITGMFLIIGVSSGPFMGGIISENFSWPWIFYINIPVGLIIIFAVYKYIPHQMALRTKKFDMIGFLFSVICLVGITVFMETLGHKEIIPQYFVYCSGAIGAAAAGFLIYHCSYRRAAIFDFTIFKVKTTRISFLIVFANLSLNVFMMFALPLIFQKCLDFTPQQSGMLLLVLPVAMFAMRIITNGIIFYFGFKQATIAALTMMAISVILLAQINSNSSIYFIMLCEIIYGASFVIINVITTTLTYVDIVPEKLSVTASMDMTFRQFAAGAGIGIGVFLSSYIANYFNIELYSPDMTAFRYVFYVIAAIPLIAILAVKGLNKTKGMREVLAGINQ